MPGMWKVDLISASLSFSTWFSSERLVETRVENDREDRRESERLAASSWLMPRCEQRVSCAKDNYNDFKTLVLPSVPQLPWIKRSLVMSAASVWPARSTLTLPRLSFCLSDYWLVFTLCHGPFLLSSIVPRLKLPLRTSRSCPWIFIAGPFPFFNQ